jgi:hypothetical protein
VNGELAQAAALASHGTHWLRTGGEVPDVIAADGPAFQFAASVGFELTSGDGQVDAFADVGAWLAGLRARGIDRLWLTLAEGAPDTKGVAIEAHQLAAFAGGGSWFLVATGSGASEAWRGTSQVGDMQAADRRIWQIRYHGVVLDEPMQPSEPDLDGARVALIAALVDAHAFAARQAAGGRSDVTMWRDTFGDALAIASAAPGGPATDETFDDDGLSADAPLAARRLLEAASRAWVFGGMGSWNDLGFDAPDDNATYDAVSRDLYAAVLAAIVAATNAGPSN